MADVPVPSIATATPDGDDTVLGVKDGLVKRFTLDNVGAGINFSNINATTNMAFNTAGVERMRITSAGNVGIGTTSPTTYSAKLVTAGAFGSSNPAVSLVNTSPENAGNIAEIQYWLANSFSGLVSVAKIGAVSGTTGNQYGSLYFSTSNAGAPVERMRLDNAGNLAMTGGGSVDAASFRDYSNTAYYLDPANTGTSMAVAGNVGVGTTSPTAKLTVSGLSSTGTIINPVNASVFLYDPSSASGAGGILAFGCTYDGTNKITGASINSAKVPTTGSGADQYNHDLVFKTSTQSGYALTEKMRLDSSGNLAMTGGGSVDAASFRDYSNTAYYLDPANTGTSLNVAGAVVQGVSTTAPTLSANNTLTFSIVDNSTLRVSVRGSDGVTRTATIALS